MTSLSVAGEITLAATVNREDQDLYQLVVMANDGVHDATTNVEILIDDINDNDPEFSEQVYYMSVSEDTQTGG